MRTLHRITKAVDLNGRFLTDMSFRTQVRVVVAIIATLAIVVPIGLLYATASVTNACGVFSCSGTSGSTSGSTSDDSATVQMTCYELGSTTTAIQKLSTTSSRNDEQYGYCSMHWMDNENSYTWDAK